MKTRLSRSPLFLLLFVSLSAGSALAGSTYILPQIADGRAGTLTIVTHFCVTNPGAIDNTVTLHLYKEDGTAWTVSLISHDRPDADGTRSSTTFTLEPNETAEFYTQGVATLATGWAKMDTSKPAVVSASYLAVDSSSAPVKPLWEVAVPPSPTAPVFVFEANVSQDDTFYNVDVNTAFAVVNPNTTNAWDGTISVSLRLHDGSSATASRTISILHGQKVSLYVSELFSSYPFTGRFHGKIRFSSDVPIAMMALRQSSGTVNTVLSATPCLPEDELQYNVFSEREPNNMVEDAQLLSLPAVVRGTINAAGDGFETDFYAVVLVAGETITINLLAETLGSPLDAHIRLYHANGTLVDGSNDPFSGTLDPRIQYEATSTSYYYIYVTAIGDTEGRDASYTLVVMKK